MQSLTILSSKMFSLLFILIIRLDVLIAPNVPAGASAQTKPILPLVMIRTEDGQLIRPTGIPHPKIDNGNVCFGTEFSGVKVGKQLFFCGKPPSKKKIRTSTTKGEDGDPDNQYISYELSESEPGSTAVEKNYLQCSHEPEPSVVKLSKKDGANKDTDVYCGSIFHMKSKMFAFVYKVKTNDDNKTHNIEMYRFCYNDVKQRVLYTEHTIASPELLSSSLLSQEQEKIYETSDKGYHFFGTRFEKIKKAYQDFLDKKEAKQLETDGLESPKITPKSKLRAENLIPADDMAFGLWRKPTYHALNAKLIADDKLILWNHISSLIRKDAINKSREYLIHTGAFDVTSEGKKENELIQSPDFWMKIVQYKNENDGEPDESIAIVMVHNPKIEMVANIFAHICKEDVCENAFVEIYRGDDNPVCCTTTMAKVDFYFDLNLENHSPLMIEKLYKIKEEMPKETQEVPINVQKEPNTYTQIKEALVSA